MSMLTGLALLALGATALKVERDGRTMVEKCLAGHAAPDRIAFYTDTILSTWPTSASTPSQPAKPQESDAMAGRVRPVLEGSAA